MFEIAENSLEPVNDEWAAQSEFWIEQTAKLAKRRNKRERNKHPLILTGHGASMRIDNGALIIRDGFTHYPHTPNHYRFFRGDLNLPNRIMLLNGSGTISFDVLSWLSEQSVTLARIAGDGNVAIAASNSGYCADPANVDWQRRTRDNELDRLEFSIGIIKAKIENSLGVLKSQFPVSESQCKAVALHTEKIVLIKSGSISTMTELLKLEGDCASAYFQVWPDLEIKWKAVNRYPIPDDWRRFTTRSSLNSEKKPKKQRASHPINAMLNYAYKIREVQLQIQAIAEGYDPTIGIMHRGYNGNAAFIYDMIEPERAKVDAAIIGLIKSQSFSGADFLLRRDGVCRLSPQLGRLVARMVSDLAFGFSPRS